MGFVQDIAKSKGLPEDNLLVQYLDRKTRAADRGSKARRSLGNLYALLVLAEDYLEGTESRFTDLLGRMRALPFGAKLQNHPLDNRLNDEFSRQYGVDGDLLPVRATTVNGQKARTISTSLLERDGADPTAVAGFIVEAIYAYIGLITEKQSGVLDEIEAIEDVEGLTRFLDKAFAPNSDARLFEIASYVLLAEHFWGQHVWVGETKESAESRPLVLFRTGRTNANDGGIDFVLQPLGRFFQVTETLDFSKYFLDFEKVNRYPFSFVIKIDQPRAEVIARIRKDAERSGKYDKEKLEYYISLFEEVFTLPDLRKIIETIPEESLGRMKDALRLQFQLEFGLLD